MNFNDFKTILSKISNLPLPGREAQFEMAPIERIKELREVDIAALNPKQAGVMALFYPDQFTQTHLVLMLRKTYKGVHSNQVGFPGGKVEMEDSTIQDTALRETEEEIGVQRHDIQVVKELTNIYIPPSNFWVQSFIGFIERTPQFVPQEEEVELLIEVPFSEFMSPDAIISKTLSTSYAIDIEVPAFQLQGHVVWGATAMMLSEVKALLQEAVKN